MCWTETVMLRLAPWLEDEQILTIHLVRFSNQMNECAMKDRSKTVLLVFCLISQRATSKTEHYDSFYCSLMFYCPNK